MHKLCLGIVSALAVSTTGSAADFRTVVDLPKGAQIDVTLMRAQSGSRIPTPRSGTFRYRQEVDPTPDGYIVRQRMVGFEFPPEVSPKERDDLYQAMAVVSNIAFETNKSLAPVRIANWPGMIESMAETMGGPGPGTLDAAYRYYESLTPEAAADDLLVEQRMLAEPQNVELSLGEPVRTTIQTTYPVGGPSIDATHIVELESLDRAAGRAVIVITQAIDAKSASARRRAEIVDAAARTSLVPRPSLAALAAVKVERTSVCRSVMDMKTGLALTTDCTQTTNTVDMALKPIMQVDRWLITQTLVAP